MQTRIRTFLGAGVLGLSCVPATLAQTGADETPAAHFERVRARYATAAWPRGAVRDGLPIALELEGFAAGELRRWGNTLPRSFSRAGAEQPSFLLEFVVADSIDGSHAALLTWLAGLQSSERMPTAAELGFELGDVAYVGRSGAGPKALSWVAFVRGNVAVRVVAFDPRREPELDLMGLAASTRSTPSLRLPPRANVSR